MIVILEYRNIPISAHSNLLKTSFARADGDYAMSGAKGKIKLRHDGRLLWKPYITLRTNCDIDIMYFPIDQHLCQIWLGSWTFDGSQVSFTDKNIVFFKWLVE